MFPSAGDTDLKTIPLNVLPSTFTDRDSTYGARRWRSVQALADNFRKRWRDNYVHELTASLNGLILDATCVREMSCCCAIRAHQSRLTMVRRPIRGSDTRVRRVVIAVSDVRGRVRETERAIAYLVPLFNANEASNDN